MNNLENVNHLRNRYFVMRHGQSKANLQEIIVSHPANGIRDEFALTDIGKEQARSAARQSTLDADTVIFSSDFSRAKETAEIVQAALGAQPIRLTELLRERHFGNWEKKDHKHYQNVWDFDKNDADHEEAGVESVNSVLGRATKLIVELEETYNNKNILLVSHGDCLQILQTGFQKIDPSKHRTLTHLQTAEIRKMSLAV